MHDYGIDGFRVDTAKNVELPARQQLKPRPARRYMNKEAGQSGQSAG
ncbi:hypothetical protein KCP75_19465 [Salmonella enterica subsp. enterica]|nr:hypothetical protein KCP75_19465 [Salmonella enterica subsp. enterica]